MFFTLFLNHVSSSVNDVNVTAKYIEKTTQRLTVRMDRLKTLEDNTKILIRLLIHPVQRFSPTPIILVAVYIFMFCPRMSSEERGSITD